MTAPVIIHPKQQKTFDELVAIFKEVDNETPQKDIIILSSGGGMLNIINNVKTTDGEYFMLMQAATKIMAEARGRE